MSLYAHHRVSCVTLKATCGCFSDALHTCPHLQLCLNAISVHTNVRGTVVVPFPGRFSGAPSLGHLPRHIAGG